MLFQTDAIEEIEVYKVPYDDVKLYSFVKDFQDDPGPLWLRFEIDNGVGHYLEKMVVSTIHVPT